MRARLAIAVSGVEVELREIVLRDKAPEFLETSPSATVPCLKLDKRVLDESLHIMAWALSQNDPEKWLEMPPSGYQLIADCDGPFKDALDHTKYTTRYPDFDPEEERSKASAFLEKWDSQLGHGYLFGSEPTLADMAILPFVRQFANIDRAWFDAQDWANVHRWLDVFLNSEQFQGIMGKYPKWVFGDSVTVFP
jgi:glutathione S-transferase